MARAARKVWFFGFPAAELLDIAGPWEVFGYANELLGRDAYSLALISSMQAAELRSRHGLMIGGLRPLPARPRSLPDIVVVPGASPRVPVPEAEARVVAWLRRHHPRIPTLVSICTGAFVLGEAGLLDGHRATTHWRYLDELRTRFPAAQVVDDGIFVHEGKLWTSAGVTAGIDLALALVGEEHGHQLAMTIAKALVLFLRRSGNQAQFSSALRRQTKTPTRLHDLSSYVLDHLDEPLPVERIAHAVGMSPRSLTRWCRAQLGESPAELVRRHRIEEAQRLLEGSDLSLGDIATRTGLGDASTLWRAFTRRLGVSPAVYRERFAMRPRS